MRRGYCLTHLWIGADADYSPRRRPACLATFTAPSFPPVLVASVYAPTERHERPVFFRFAHQHLREAFDLRPHLRGRVAIGGDLCVCLADDDKEGGNETASALRSCRPL